MDIQHIGGVKDKLSFRQKEERTTRNLIKKRLPRPASSQ